MNRLILLFGMLALALSSLAPAQSDARLVGHLKSVYQSWQAAMVRKDAATWKRLTSTRRQVSVRNRLWSERRRFPDAIIEAQMTPPIINNLKAMSVRINGNTAKATYFGKVDFGVGGAGENLCLLREGGSLRNTMAGSLSNLMPCPMFASSFFPVTRPSENETSYQMV